MGTQLGHVDDEKFSNWVKDTLALLYTKECLEVIVDERSPVFHGQLKAAVGNNLTCTCSWQKLERGKKKWVVKNCSGVCQSWLDQIISHHNKRPFPKLAPRNTDPSLWPSDTWEVMKVYQSNGCQGQHSARDADVAALIDLMRNCDHFAPLITNPSFINQIIKIRNQLMHSKDFHVENPQLSCDLQSMLDFFGSLSAVTGASSLSVTERQAVQTAITQVNKLCTGILDITLNRELQLKAIKAKQVALETDMKVLEQTINDARADTAAVRSDLTGVEDKQSKEVQTLQQHLAFQLTMIEDVKKGLTSQLSMIQDIKKGLSEQQQSTATVVNNLARLQQQFDVLKQGLDETQSNITTLKQHMSDLEVTSQQQARTMTTLYQRQQTTERTITTLNQRQQTTDSTITTLNQRQQDTDSTITTLNQRQQDTDSTITTLNQRQQDTDSTITTLNQRQQDTDSTITTLNQRQQDTDSTITTLNQRQQDTDNTITTLNQRQQDTDSTITTLNQRQQDTDNTITTLNQRQQATDTELQNQRVETQSHASRLQQHQTELDNHTAKLGQLEQRQVAQQTAQPVDIKRLQRQLISLYKDQRQHIPVYLLRPERKHCLEDIYVEQRLKLVDPDGRMKTDSSISHSRRQTRSDFMLMELFDGSEAGTSEKIISSLREVFYSEDSKCQHVYVSGNAGYGKSVFCSHLVRLWCNAHSGTITALTQDEDMMAEFSLLFCVDLRDAKYEGTDEVCSLIQKQLQLSNFGLTINDLSKLLHDNDQVGQVLVVMDALDECKEERLPRGGLYNCTTLVTSRPWKLEAVRCDTEYRVDKELEIVGLKKGSPKDLSEKLVTLLNKQWNKSKNGRDFIQKMESEDLQEFLEVPVLLTAMLCLWHDDVPFGQSQVEVYRTSIHHQMLAAVKAKGIPEYSCSSEAPFPICQREKCQCKCYGELLWKVSELACKALLGNVRERSLVMDHDQTEFLGLTDKEVAICMKLGILTQYKLLGNITDYEPQKSVSFTHKTYQEWFTAVYLSSKLSMPDLENQLPKAIDDLDSALELDQMFLFVCGLNAEVAVKLSEFIMSKVSSDTRVQEYRRSKYSHRPLIITIQDVIVAGAVEAIKNNKETKALQLHDVYINAWYSREQVFACDTSHARSIYINTQESRKEKSKIIPWPASSCLEKVELKNTLYDTFCSNFSAAHLVVLYLNDVRLPHDQMMTLCQSLASPGSLKTVEIGWLTCITHKDNRQDCSIMLDLSQHQGLEHLTLQDLGVGEVLGVSFGQNMMKLETVELYSVTLTHDQLESLCQSLATAVSLRTVYMTELTCITHKDNRQDCSIMLDLSQHQGLEDFTLQDLGVGEVQGVSFGQNMMKLETVELYSVTLTHDQLESLCQSLATAVSLRTVIIRQLTCITHKDNRQDCSIMLDLSQHQGLEHLKLQDLGVGEVQGVSFGQNMMKLETVELYSVTLTHDLLESLCQSLASAENLETIEIEYVTCLTHKDNEKECNIQLDFSQYVSFQKICKSWWVRPVIKITSWPSSSMETVDLQLVDISSCDTFCGNFNVDNVSIMYLENVILTHDQLGSLATAVSLREVTIRWLTCITHKDNRQDCSIMLDLSQHQGLEHLTLQDLGVGEVLGVSFGQNMMKLETVELYSVTLTHDQLESLCQSLATAVSLRTVNIRQLTCITHKDNRQDCSIMLDLSQHQGLEDLTLQDLGVGEVQGVSFGQNMDKPLWVKLAGFCISAAALRHTLEAFPGHRVEVELGGHFHALRHIFEIRRPKYAMVVLGEDGGVSPLRVRGAEEARKLLEEISQATYTDVSGDDVEYTGDECVVKRFRFSNK